MSVTRPPPAESGPPEASTATRTMGITAEELVPIN
jgi:hypothetical protein